MYCDFIVAFSWAQFTLGLSFHLPCKFVGQKDEDDMYVQMQDDMYSEGD